MNSYAPISLLIALAFSLACPIGTHAQEENAQWNPNFDHKALVSMPDLLPLLGIFGSEWHGAEAGGEEPEVHAVLMDWTGREGEPLVLPADADVVVLNAGVNDLSDPEQRQTSVRHISVEAQPNAASGFSIHSQILLLDRGVDLHGDPMKYGTEYILHFPDGTRGMVSTNSVGAMSSSGIPIRTAAYLIHAGGKVYVGQ